MTLNSPTVTANDRALAYAEKIRESQRECTCEVPYTLKYMRGQRVLLLWMCYEFAAIHNAQILVDLSASPRLLDKKLKEIGYFWDAKARLWKLRKGYAMPIFGVRWY